MRWMEHFGQLSSSPLRITSGWMEQVRLLRDELLQLKDLECFLKVVLRLGFAVKCKCPALPWNDFDVFVFFDFTALASWVNSSLHLEASAGDGTAERWRWPRRLVDEHIVVEFIG